MLDTANLVSSILTSIATIILLITLLLYLSIPILDKIHKYKLKKYKSKIINKKKEFHENWKFYCYSNNPFFYTSETEKIKEKIIDNSNINYEKINQELDDFKKNIKFDTALEINSANTLKIIAFYIHTINNLKKIKNAKKEYKKNIVSLDDKILILKNYKTYFLSKIEILDNFIFNTLPIIIYFYDNSCIKNLRLSSEDKLKDYYKIDYLINPIINKSSLSSYKINSYDPQNSNEVFSYNEKSDIEICLDLKNKRWKFIYNNLEKINKNDLKTFKNLENELNLLSENKDQIIIPIAFISTKIDEIDKKIDILGYEFAVFKDFDSIPKHIWSRIRIDKYGNTEQTNGFVRVFDSYYNNLILYSSKKEGEIIKKFMNRKKENINQDWDIKN